jgi:hypothetical protein
MTLPVVESFRAMAFSFTRPNHARRTALPMGLIGLSRLIGLSHLIGLSRLKQKRVPLLAFKEPESC